MCHGKEGSSMKCKYCSGTFDDVLIYRLHFDIIHRNLLCVHCDTHFGSPRELKSHVKRDHGIKRSNEDQDETESKRIKLCEYPTESDPTFYTESEAHQENQNDFEDQMEVDDENNVE